MKLPEFIEPNKTLYVKYFGFEIEGGFSSEIGVHDDQECECSSETLENYGCECGAENNYKHKDFKEDGSVRSRNYIAGEIASPKFRIDRFLQFTEYTKTCMPSESNSSSGVHIHLSFNNNLAYAKCMDSDFYEKLRKAVWNEIMESEKYSLDTMALFEDRYNDVYHGHCNYCSSSFMPDTQMDSSWAYFFPDENNNGRYTQLNYCAYRSHGTLELRLFPSTTNRTELIQMVKFFIDFTQNYLDSCGSYERGNYIQLESDEVESELHTEVLLCV